MKAELVFIEPEKLGAVPFTTSDLIAEFAGVTHHAVQQLLTKHQNDFETFGVFAFEMRKPNSGNQGGRPETVYHLNEEQATLLMTYLKNTPQVREFKKELVKQFYAMRKRLTAQAIQREKRKPIRRSMTDAIRDYIPDSPHKGMMYKHFTDLVYKSALGKNAAQLRKERNAPPKANIAEFLTVEECQAVAQREQLVSVLIQTGADYSSVKAVLSQNWLVTTRQRARAPPRTTRKPPPLLGLPVFHLSNHLAGSAATERGWGFLLPPLWFINILLPFRIAVTSRPPSPRSVPALPVSLHTEPVFCQNKPPTCTVGSHRRHSLRKHEKRETF